MIDWERIEQFIGYGRIDAPVVFIGMEEGLADQEALKEDLRVRSTFEPVMDLEAAHRGIVDGQSLFSDSPRRQPTWRVMADVMLHYEGALPIDPSQRALARKKYRAKRLGRSDGNSLLMELLPYPHKKASSWLYSAFGRFQSRSQYLSEVLPNRLRILETALRSANRTVILCYGRSNWEVYKLLFPEVQWSAVDRFERGRWHNATVLLTNHFATKYFNSDAQLDQLSLVALSG
jgi:hypothetical protein